MFRQERGRMRRAFLTITALASGPILAAMHGATVDDVQSLIEHWLDTNRIISETRRDWISEKTLLSQETKLLEMEASELEEKSERLQSLNAQAHRDREDAIAKNQRYEELLSYLQFKIDALEKRVLEILPTLPKPLMEQVASSVMLIDEDAKGSRQASISERLQALVSIIMAAEEFNSKVTLTHEMRTLDGAEAIQVKVLYWGLAGAYAMSPSGEVVQTGHPGNDGWIWENRPEFAEQIRQLIRIREGTQEAAFIRSPIVVKGGRR